MPNVAEQVSLAKYTTFKIGGPARFFAAAKSIEDIQSLVSWAKDRSVPILFLGGGSNVLVSDAGFAGLVIKLELDSVAYEERSSAVLATAGAGMVLDELIKDTVEKGLWGLENLSHIPGSVGATPVQNVGAYGVEVGDLIEEVCVLDIEENAVKKMNNAECEFAYRNSFFKTVVGKKMVVLSVTFKLERVAKPDLTYKDLSQRFAQNPHPTQREIREAVIDIRRQKFPDWQVIGTAGSFFKNPIILKADFDSLLERFPELPGFILPGNKVKVPLGWILDKVCQLRGYRDGNVGTYEGQSLVIVNYGGATAADIKKLAHTIEEKVFAETKIKIEWEVTAV